MAAGAGLMALASGLDPAAAGASEPVTLWPLYSRDRNVFGEERVRSLGPIFQRLEATNGAAFLGVHPLYSQVRLPEDRDRREHQVLWPVWFGRGADNQYKWQVLVLLFWHDYDITQSRSKHHLWLLPVYFQGRNAEGRPYVALFPVGGKIRDFLGSDELGFALFPLYGYSKLKDQETVTALWPIYSRTTGPNNQKLRVFPLYGHARFRNVCDTMFLMWPFWSQASYSYRKSAGYSYFLFPLWGHLNVTDQEAWWVVPPFVRFSTRGDNRRYYLPWPFVQVERGHVEKFYLWPLWGHKTAHGFPYTFYLWPIVRYWKEDEGGLWGDQLMIMPVWYSRTDLRPARDAEAGGEVLARRRKFWPFFTYRREGDRSRLGVPSLCPFRDVEAIERNYAPLWTLYSRQRNGGLVEDDLLWGLYRYRRGPGQRRVELFPLFRVESDTHNGLRSWSFLKGLVAREERRGEVAFTLLYGLTFRSRLESADRPQGPPEPP